MRFFFYFVRGPTEIVGPGGTGQGHGWARRKALGSAARELRGRPQPRRGEHHQLNTIVDSSFPHLGLVLVAICASIVADLGRVEGNIMNSSLFARALSPTSAALRLPSSTSDRLCPAVFLVVVCVSCTLGLSAFRPAVMWRTLCVLRSGLHRRARLWGSDGLGKVWYQEVGLTLAGPAMKAFNGRG